MKNSFEAKARAYGWHLSYVQVYLRKRKNSLFGSNRTKRKPALPSLYIEETKVVASNTNLERDEMIESVDTESAEELWIQNRKRHLRKDRTHGRRSAASINVSVQ